MTVALILLEGLSFGVMLIGLVLLLAALLDPYRPSLLGEKLLLWGAALVLAGAACEVAVAVTLT